MNNADTANDINNDNIFFIDFPPDFFNLYFANYTTNLQQNTNDFIEFLLYHIFPYNSIDCFTLANLHSFTVIKMS